MAGRKPVKFTDEKIAEALRQTLGNQSAAAKILNCSRSTIARACRTSEKVKAALDEADEVVFDMVEMKLNNAISNGEPWAIKMFLSLKGWKRGYSEHQEVNVTAKSDPFASVPTEQLEKIISEHHNGMKEIE